MTLESVLMVNLDAGMLRDSEVTSLLTVLDVNVEQPKHNMNLYFGVSTGYPTKEAE